MATVAPELVVAVAVWTVVLAVAWRRLWTEPPEGGERVRLGPLLDALADRWPWFARVMERAEPLRERVRAIAPGADDVGTLVVVGLVFGGLFVVGALLDEIAEASTLVRVDQALSRLAAHAAPLVPAAELVSQVSSPIGATVVAVGVVVLLLLRGRWRDALGLGVAGFGTFASTAAIKVIAGRERPAGAVVYEPEGGAFPSGHTSGTAVVAFFLAWLLTRHRPRDRPVAVALASVITLLVGLSRMVLDVHWLSDVAAGAALGVAWTAFGVLVSRPHR